LIITVRMPYWRAREPIAGTLPCSVLDISQIHMPFEANGLLFGTGIVAGPVGQGLALALVVGLVVPAAGVTAAALAVCAAAVAAGGASAAAGGGEAGGGGTGTLDVDGVVVCVVTAGVVVVVGTAGVVTVTVPPTGFVPPSAVGEQNGVATVVPACEVVELDVGVVVGLVLDTGAVGADAPPIPLPPSPGTPPATAVAERGPRIAIATVLVASNRVKLVRGGRLSPVPRSGGSGVPRLNER
jgi:hypothetical protein